MRQQQDMLCIVVLIVCCVFLTDVSVDAQLIVKPSNTASLAGSKVVLQCATSGTPAYMYWAYTPSLSSTSVFVVSRCTVQPGYTSQYSVNMTETGRCDLVINEATLDMAGKYQCGRQAYFAISQLTVIESCPTGSQSSTTAAVGDKVTTSCWLSYGGSSPQLQLTPGGEPSNRTNGSIVVTSLSTVIQPGMTVVPPQSCSVSFPGVPVHPTCDSWQSSEIHVTYCAQNVEISGVSNGTTVPAGSELRCSAEGHPPPTYQWTAVTGNVEVTRSSVTVQRADTYYVLTCTASNVITHADGTTEDCSTSSTVYFNSSDVPPATTATTTSRPASTQRDLVLILGLSLGLGIPLFIFIVLSILCICCPCCPLYRFCCRQPPASDRPQNLDRDQPLSDMNQNQETDTAQAANYQQPPTDDGGYLEPRIYHDIANTASDTNTESGPYEDLDRQQPRLYHQLANCTIF